MLALRYDRIAEYETFHTLAAVDGIKCAPPRYRRGALGGEGSAIVVYRGHTSGLKLSYLR